MKTDECRIPGYDGMEGVSKPAGTVMDYYRVPEVPWSPGKFRSSLNPPEMTLASAIQQGILRDPARKTPSQDGFSLSF
jgi:hypothetical protein